MHYQSLSAWIFALLILIIAFMAVFPTPAVIGGGVILTPILVLYQAYAVLTADEPAAQPTQEDQWYEN